MTPWSSTTQTPSQTPSNTQTPSVTPSDPTCSDFGFDVTLTPQPPTPSLTSTPTPTPSPITNVSGQTVVFVIDSGYFEPIFFNNIKLVSGDVFTAELNGEEKCVRFVSETNGSSTHFIQNISEKHTECCVDISPTPTITQSLTPTPTNTPSKTPPEEVNSSFVAVTPTPTNTPSMTHTPTNSVTPTNTPSITPSLTIGDKTIYVYYPNL